MVSSVARWDDEAHRRRPLRAAHPGDRDESAVAERIIEDEVRELVRRREMDPGGDAAVRSLIDDVVADYAERTLTASMPALVEPAAMAKAVADRVIGLGPLQGYFDDPEIEEIWINQPDKVFVAKAGRPILTGTVLSEEQVHDVAAVRAVPGGLRGRGHQSGRRGRYASRQDDPSELPGQRDSAARAAGDLRGGFRAPDRSTGRRGDADPAAQPRRPRRDSAAPARQGGAPDAPEPPDRGRGAAGGDARPADRVEQRHRRNDLAARQLRARGARQAGHAAVAGRREHHASVHRPDGGGGHRSDRVPAVRPRWAPSGRRGDRGTGPGRRWRDRVAAAVLPGRRRAAVDRALSAARGALPRRRHRPWRGALRMRRAAQ